MRLDFFLLISGLALAVPLAASEGASIPPEHLALIEEVLDSCPWGTPSDLEAARDPADKRQVEITVIHVGKISLRESDDGQVIGEVLVTRKDAWAFAEEALSRQPDATATEICAAIPVEHRKLQPGDALASRILHNLDQLKSVFRIPGSIQIHQPRVVVQVHAFNFHFEAEWLGCEDGSLGEWATASLIAADKHLKPCGRD